MTNYKSFICFLATALLYLITFLQEISLDDTKREVNKFIFCLRAVTSFNVPQWRCCRKKIEQNLFAVTIYRINSFLCEIYYANTG